MANRVSVEFGASTGELKSAVDDVNASLDSIKGHVEGLTSGFQSLAALAGVALSFEGLKAGFNELAAFADEIQNAQSRMGGSLESMTTLSGVATLTGVSFRSLTQDVALANLQVQKSVSDAYGPASQGLRALGLSARELQALPTDKWFEKVSDAVSRFRPSLTLTSNVQQAFGRGMAELMPLLTQGGEHFREMQEAVKRAQVGLAATLPGISETEEKLTLLGLSSRNFAAQVFTVLKPAIDKAIDAFVSLTQSITSDDIRNAARVVASSLINLAASVAEFFVRVGVSVDGLKEKLADGFKLDLDFGTIDGPAEKALELMARLSGNYERMKDVFDKPISLNFNAPPNFVERFSAIKTTLDDQIAAIENFKKKALEWTDSALTKPLMKPEVDDRPNAPAADNGGRNRITALATEIEEQIGMEKAKLERIKSIFNEEASTYRITQNEKALYTEAAIEQAFQAEMALIAKKEAIYRSDAVKYAEVEKEKAKLTDQYQKEMLATVQSSQREMTASITSGLQTFTGSFNSQLRGLLAGTTSWAQATKNIGADMFLKLVELGEQWVVKRAASMIADAFVSKTQAAADVATTAATEAAKTQAVVAGAAARATAEASGGAAGIAAQVTNAVTSVAIDSGKTYAGVFGFLAPIMGPAAAGPAEASAAATLAGGLAPLAVGAWEIPGVMPALLHPGEMVLPQTFASGLRSQLSGGDGGGGGGGGSSVFAPNFSGFIGTQAMINQIMPQLARAFRAHQAINPSVA